MQVFTVKLTVTVNTAETVSAAEVRESLEEQVAAYGSGSIEVDDVTEQ